MGPREIVEATITARTIEDVNRLEEAMKRQGANREEYLGGRRSNWSAVAGGADPRTAPFERVTNMFDAVLELKAQLRQDFSCTSPQEAARRLLGVPSGGLEELSDADARKLAERCRVALHDSNDSARAPTISFRDYGLGLAPREMPTTILSLEGSNKLDKFYLHGLFGKGGSVACVYSEATVYVSRKHPELLKPGEEDRVSIAIVRKDDREDVRLPFFRYLANTDGTVFSVPASEVDFEPGTLVLHVNYQGEKLGTSTWQHEESIYALAETTLFRPTLPYLLADERTGHANRRPEGRGAERLMGLGRRLNKVAVEDLKRRGGPAEIEVPGLGRAIVRWWLFDSANRVRRRLARGYHTLFMTGGQVHHNWNRQGFVTRVEGRTRVASALIVEVDLDAIPQKKRVTIFSSFRDRMIHSPEAVALEHAVADWLANDPDLAKAERELVREALSSSGNGISRELRKKLNNLIRERVPGIGVTQVTDGVGPKPPKPKQPEDLHPEPTALTGPAEITVLPGKPKSFYMQLNARDGFIPDIGEFEITPRDPGVTISVSRGALAAGRLQVSVTVDKDTNLGDYQLDATVSWISSSGGMKTITWPIVAHVVSALKPSKPGKPSDDGRVPRKVRKEIGVALIWRKDEPQNGVAAPPAGNLEDITGSELAAVHPESYDDLDGVETRIQTIVLEEGFPGWRDYKRRALTGGASDRVMDIRKEKYALALGVTIANLCQQERKFQKAYLAWEEGGRQGDEPTKPMDDEQLRRAINEAAYGTIAFLLDMDKVLTELDALAGNEAKATVHLSAVLGRPGASENSEPPAPS